LESALFGRWRALIGSLNFVFLIVTPARQHSNNTTIERSNKRTPASDQSAPASTLNDNNERHTTVEYSSLLVLLYSQLKNSSALVARHSSALVKNTAVAQN
jgi:hypothetical protein